MGSGWMQCFDMGLIISMHVSRRKIQVGIILINFESFWDLFETIFGLKIHKMILNKVEK